MTKAGSRNRERAHAHGDMPSPLPGLRFSGRDAFPGLAPGAPCLHPFGVDGLDHHRDYHARQKLQDVAGNDTR